MVIGAITSGVILGDEEGTWPILVSWFAIVVINMPSSRMRRWPQALVHRWDGLSAAQRQLPRCGCPARAPAVPCNKGER
jgi:hypothetical protein